MMYVKFPLSLRNVEDLLAERGIDICHETLRLWWNRFDPMFAAERGPPTPSQTPCDERPELDGPAPDRLVADLNPPREKLLDVPKT